MNVVQLLGLDCSILRDGRERIMIYGVLPKAKRGDNKFLKFFF